MVFISRFSLYEFTVLPFGLCKALSSFQHLTNNVFSDIKGWYVLVYLDNILLYSETTKDLEKHLHGVFLWLCTHKLQAKYAKCEIRHA